MKVYFIKFKTFVSECTNYLSQPVMENGKPIDPAYEVNIASKFYQIKKIIMKFLLKVATNVLINVISPI